MAAVVGVLGHQQVQEAALLYAHYLVDVVGVRVYYRQLLGCRRQHLLPDSLHRVQEHVLGKRSEMLWVE